MVDNPWFPNYRQSWTEKIKLLEEQIDRLSTPDGVKLRWAVWTVVGHIAVGTAVGLSVGGFLARRSLKSQRRVAEAFHRAEQPIAVVFASGRTEASPNIRKTLSPSKAGKSVPNLVLRFAGVGLILGASTGYASGLAYADFILRKDMASRVRMASAIDRYEATVMKKEMENLREATNRSRTDP
ncbi:MAG: hypothetical protein Q9182_002654 [Xanthomendoza sp. 2 TL-2023]